MSIELTLRRVSPDVYDRMMRGESPFPYRYVAESGQIAKRWEVTAVILAHGDHTDPGPAVAIVGGRRTPGEREVDQDFGGTRLFSPAEVIDVAEALGEFPEQEFLRRYEEFDFTDVYGSDGEGRPEFGVEVYLSDFRHLHAFYGAAAQAGDAMMLWLD
ncbi:DUF1877 family protein [Streptomyces sp. NPDC057413]|uniref:DUF1877 family protein n=1 Tax=unclassified Streptomyces TaxID=2593676 RepID=UPI0036653D1E